MTQFKAIGGLASNKEGDIYVSDYGNGRVEEFSPSGAYLRKFATQGTGSGQLYEPTGIAIDSSGNVWVRSSYGVLVQEFSTLGASIRTFDEGGAPHAIASDPVSGNLYVTEPGKDRVEEFSATGTAIATFGTAGTGTGQLSAPEGVAVGSSETVFIADMGKPG